VNDRNKDAAAEEDALEGTGREMEGLEGPVPAIVKKNADFVYSLRLTGDDLAELQRAAARKGMKISQVIRNGALEYARKEESPAAEEVRAKIRELAEAASRL
jgi:hypothetical protein